MRALDELVELRLSAPEPPSAMMDLDPMEVDTLRGGWTICRSAPRAAAPAGRRSGAAPQRPRRVAPGGGGRDVLVVEDSPIARQFLKAAPAAPRLPRDRVRLRRAALELLSRRTFEMVFLDVVLGRRAASTVCSCASASSSAARSAPAAHGGGDGHWHWTAPPTACAARWPAAMPTSPSRCTSEFIATLLQVDPAFEWQADTATAARRSVRVRAGADSKAATGIRAPPPSNWPSR